MPPPITRKSVRMTCPTDGPLVGSAERRIGLVARSRGGPPPRAAKPIPRGNAPHTPPPPGPFGASPPLPTRRNRALQPAATGTFGGQPALHQAEERGCQRDEPERPHAPVHNPIAEGPRGRLRRPQLLFELPDPVEGAGVGLTHLTFKLRDPV